ncbi:MAG TPA: hypothetical protein VHD33_04845 [Legionellaceae bacterium]|nr:hypothetical protein [Legionellaceae bacterium]
MRTIEQQREQIKMMIAALRLSLSRLCAFKEKSAEIDNALYLHCCMIVFYQRIDALLASSQFITFFNKRLTHLLNEKQCSTLFKKLEPPYRFEIPVDLSEKEWKALLQFAALLPFEAQEALNKRRKYADTLNTLGVEFGVSGIFGFIAISLVLVSFPPTTFALSTILISLASVCMLLLIGYILELLYRSEIAIFMDITKELSPIRVRLRSLYQDIVDSTTSICPNNSVKIPNIYDDLPTEENDLDKKNNFAKLQASFFQLPKEFTISSVDLESVAQSQLTVL